MTFDVSDEEQAIINKWVKKLERKIFKKGQSPYYGAVGGELEYRFTPTSIGTILCVKYSRSEKVLNVTEANDWKDFG